MIKSISMLMLLLAFQKYNIPHRDTKGKDYLIIGHNSIQKIYYSTSSDFSVNHKGTKAMDSDLKSAWLSKRGGPHWMEIDFGSKRLMTKIVVHPGKKDNYRTIKYFVLQFLYNNKWFYFTTVNMIDFKKSSKSFLLYPFSSKRSKYVKYYKDKAVIDLGGVDASSFRIFMPDDATFNGYAAIAEIETYIGSNKLKYFDERLKGLFLPIKNGFLPEDNSRYPNAPRKYRGGKHVGLDILYYHTDDSYNPLKVNKTTPVYACDKGVIIRADWNYKPMTAKEWLNQSKYYKKHPRTFVKRSFGGRQVWIDHGNGIVTTYNHLSKIDDIIDKGYNVQKGQRIGWVGNSGLMGEAEEKDYGMHLHFEIWIDGFYLGYGMKIKDIKRYITWIFSIHQ